MTCREEADPEFSRTQTRGLGGEHSDLGRAVEEFRGVGEDLCSLCRHGTGRVGIAQSRPNRGRGTDTQFNTRTENGGYDNSRGGSGLGFVCVWFTLKPAVFGNWNLVTLYFLLLSLYAYVRLTSITCHFLSFLQC